MWDVPTQSDLLSDKGIDPVSGRPYIDIVATGVTNAAYTRSTEPFEIVPDTFYYVGDNEVSLYLFDTDMGTRSPRDDKLVLIDTGWPNSGYQYWKNIEAMGYDPRDIDVVVMPHGHGDHYGTTVELVTMIENSGGRVDPALPRARTSSGWPGRGRQHLEPAAGPPGDRDADPRAHRLQRYDECMDFGNVRLMPVRSPGPHLGLDLVRLRRRDPEAREPLTFGYMGGYGWHGPKIVSPTNGWQPARLRLQPGLAPAAGRRRLRRPAARQPVPARGHLPGAQGVQQRPGQP